jgi:hypothetical protein
MYFGDDFLQFFHIREDYKHEMPLVVQQTAPIPFDTNDVNTFDV